MLVLTAVGVGWPDGGTALQFPGVTGLGWPGRRPARPASQPEQVTRGALLNGHAESPLPDSDRVRQALSTAVPRGTPGVSVTDNAFGNGEDQMPRSEEHTSELQ